MKKNLWLRKGKKAKEQGTMGITRDQKEMEVSAKRKGITDLDLGLTLTLP